jgi:hypothetical protein
MRRIAPITALFAQEEGSVAAPTAGPAFHRKAAGGPKRTASAREAPCTSAPAPFLPVKADDTAEHTMYAEFGTVAAGTAEVLNAVRAGRAHRCRRLDRLRLLKARSAVGDCAFSGETAIFITPATNSVVDLMLTNLHRRARHCLCWSRPSSGSTPYNAPIPTRSRPVIASIRTATRVCFILPADEQTLLLPVVQY